MVAGFGRTKPNCAVLSMAARSRQTREGKVRVAGLVLGPGLRLEAVMRRMLIVTAAGAAMLPRVRPSLREALVLADGHRRRGHAMRIATCEPSRCVCRR